MFSSSNNNVYFRARRSLGIRPLCLLSLSLTFSLPALASDWAYELPNRAKDIYIKKEAQYSCKELQKLISTKSEKAIYITIRDAGIFRDPSCSEIIQKNRAELMKIPGLPNAIDFYDYRLGDAEGLNRLARSFDLDAKRTQDHWTVSLFGFLNDWEVSGKRLVRHSAYSDGAGSELLCSALKWRRYLYGEVDFEKHWFSIGKKEGVKHDKLQDKYEFCRP